MEKTKVVKVEKKKCIHCLKTLPVFGCDRKNGKESYGGWKGRTMHKKCWKDGGYVFKLDA